MIVCHSLLKTGIAIITVFNVPKISLPLRSAISCCRKVCLSVIGVYVSVQMFTQYILL